MSAHRLRSAQLGLLALLVAALAGCSGVSGPTVSPTRLTTPLGSTPAGASPVATSGGSAAPSAGSTPSSAGPFVAANVRVLPQPIAKIDGDALAIAAPDDGSGRLFVATQEGRIWSVGPGPAHDLTLLLDIANRITSGGERGLLGIALHPGFPNDPRVFVDYTDRDGNTVVSSFELRPNAGTFDPGSEHIVLRQEQPFANHNGGGVVFGPDGELYIGLGDGGSGGDPNGNGQRLDTLLAKILRIDVDHAGSDAAYSIPAGNPFAGRSGARAEIWLYGLRNPFRLSFDRASGDLWIGDVGQGRWEEVDVVRAGDHGGEDFGWNVMEGTSCYTPPDGCDGAGLTPPVAEYGHDQGCAIIGGNVYRGNAYPALQGGYLFSDSCSGTVWAIPATTTSLVQPVPVGEVGGSPAGFGEDPAGELFIASLDGTIWQVTAVAR